jgi:hypothetical protein
VSSRSDFLAQLFEAFNRRLVAAGFPEISPWWAREIRRFMLSGKRRWVIRAGRRSGKSTTLCRLAVAWALFGSWDVPTGDIAVVPFVSVSRDEAAGRLRTIREILRALGIKFDERGDEFELSDKRFRRVVFRVVTASTTAVVGFTSIAVFGDEVARWESRDHAANPATEVFGSLMPTLATQPEGFAVLSSSAWSDDDFHAEAFARGETDDQCVSAATTWEANPTITEEATHSFEPNPSVWAREYQNVPSASLSVALPQEHVRDAIRAVPTGESGRPVLVLDPSSGRGDAFAHALARWVKDGDRHTLVISELEAIEGRFYGIRSADSIVEELARKAKRVKAVRVVSDQREELALEAAFRRQSLRFTSIAWTVTTKTPAVERLRRLLADRQIVLPDDPALRRELAAFQQKLMPSGYVTFGARASGHDDRVAVLLTAMMADAEGLLERSPLARRRTIADVLLEDPHAVDRLRDAVEGITGSNLPAGVRRFM